MGEQSRTPSIQPIAPAGASLYILDLNQAAIPLHLLFSNADRRSGQLIVPMTLQPSKPIEPSQETSLVVPKVTKNTQEVPVLQSKPEVGLELDNHKQKNTPNMVSSKNSNTKNNNTEAPKASKDSKRLQSKREVHQKKIQNKEYQRVQSYIHIRDSVVPTRAVAVLPKSLHIRHGCIYPRRALPPRIKFGPVQGVQVKIFPAEADELKREATATGKPIFLFKKDEGSVTHIDVSDKDRSNWLSLLPLGGEDTANVWIYEEDNKLYGLTTKHIPSRTCLILGYSQRYAEEHNLPPGVPILDLDEALAEPKWWCFECRRAMGSSSLLLRHMKAYHEDDCPPRKMHRCSYCFRTYGRLFTLRRHMSKFCKRKVAKIDPENEPIKPDPEFTIQHSTEETRTPSDESFQNYTAGLDFSTNLFDPDRISNVDMSGSSKSETDFNSYTGLKFDNLDNNEDYSKFCKGLKLQEDEREKAKNDDLAIVTCPHCEQTMTKAKKRRHLKECSVRRLKCECGKIFTRRDEFGKHVHAHHITRSDPSDTSVQIKEKPDDEDKTSQYICNGCNVKFKRRGMLVNHLWRIHKTSAAAVPLERRIRHYPCSVCPKIYRTAAKRNQHVVNHHPGVRIRPATIEGERRVSQPAKCTACPREYATRSKLLQHIRAQHPALALEMKKQLPSSPSRTTEKSEKKLAKPTEPMLGCY